MAIEGGRRKAEGGRCEFQPRIFDPSRGGGATLSAEMGLLEFYAAYVRPVVLSARRAAKRNYDQIEQSLGYWDRLTGDPPLSSIDEFTCARFVEGLMQLPGRKRPTLADNTIRKHCAEVQIVLDLAGPRSRQQRAAKGLLEAVPYLERPPAVEEDPEFFTLEEISQWLSACRRATVPKIPGVNPGSFWIALVLWCYNVGTRIETTLRITWKMIGPDRRSGGHWLKVPAAIHKGRRQGKEFCVNQPALAAAESIRTAAVRVFPWPHTLGYLQKVRRDILAQTDIPPERRFGFHGLRKALGTMLAEENALVAQKQLGHSSLTTTRKHYAGKRVVRRTLGRLRQPKPDDRQLRLF